MSNAFNIPAGFALVPLEPTMAMLTAGIETIWPDGGTSTRNVYRAMIDAAPTPPVDAGSEPVAADRAVAAPEQVPPRYSREYVADMEDTLKQIADALGCQHDADKIIAAVKAVAAPEASGDSELLSALVDLRRACDAIRPFAGVVAPVSPNITQALSATDFIDEIARTDEIIGRKTK